MLESLRGLGYSPEAALADTIDNSISAMATAVDILFSWDGQNSYVAIVKGGVKGNQCGGVKGVS